MVKTILMILCAAVIVIAGQGFNSGYQAGYKAGYCYRCFGCLPPLPPLPPLPRLGESTYNDGYQRGFIEGLEDNRCRND